MIFFRFKELGSREKVFGLFEPSNMTILRTLITQQTSVSFLRLLKKDSCLTLIKGSKCVFIVPDAQCFSDHIPVLP